MRSRKQRAFLNKTISDIARQIAGEYSLSARSGSSGGPLDFVLQNNETDWDFLWRLAKRVGFEVTLDGTTLCFDKPDGSAAEIELAYPDDLHAFRPRITSVQQVEQGQRPRLRLQAQAGRHEHEDAPGAAHRGRHHPQGGRRRVRREHAGDRRPVVQLAGRGRRDRPGGARPARERLPRRRGRDVRQPRHQGGRQAQDHRRRQEVLRHLPRRQGRARPAERRLRHASSPTRPASTPSSGSRARTATCRAASTRSWSAS